MSRPAAWIVVALLAAAVGAVRLMTDDGSRPPLPGGAATVDSRSPEKVPPAPQSHESTPVAFVPFGVDVVEGSEAPTTRAFRMEVDREHDLHGRVMDSERKALKGAVIVVSRRDGSEFGEPWQEQEQEGREVARTVTDDAGEFRVPLEQGRRYDVRASAEGMGAVTIAGRSAGAFVEILLRPGATLRGTVTRLVDGSPIVGARVRTLRGSFPRNELETVTDAEGTFGFESLSDGLMIVAAWPTEDAPSQQKPVDLKPGVVSRVDLVVKAARSVSGRVIDARSGDPVEGAEVGDLGRPEKAVRTDVEGRYELRGFSGRATESGESAGLFVKAVGFSRATKQLTGTAPEVVANFALKRGRMARGRIVYADGSPAADVAVVGAGYGRIADSWVSDWIPARTNAEGEYRVADLERELRHSLWIRKEGFGSLIYDFPWSERDVETVELPEVVLRRGGFISGVVVDDLDRPVFGARISLKGCNADRFQWASRVDGDVSADPLGGGRVLDGRTAQVDDLGRFHFGDLAEGPYRLKVDRPYGNMRVAVDEFVASGARVEGVRLVVAEKPMIAGRVLDAAGAPVAEAAVVAFREPMEGDGGRVTATTDTVGRFLLRGLAADAYTIDAQPNQTLLMAPRGVAFVRTKGVRAGTVDVVLKFPGCDPIQGRVIDESGAPIVKALVDAFDADGELVGRAWTAADGTFKVDARRGESVDVRAQASSAGGTESAPARGHGWTTTKERVPAGTTDLELRITAGR
jgi:hypothetical protein